MSFLKEFKKIKLFAFDIDGVLTDGTIYVFETGEQVRRMSIKDGFALQLAIKKGYHIVVLSGANSEAAKTRLNKLGIHAVFLQVEDKKNRLDEYLREQGILWEEVLFMGDDIPDYEAMKHAGISSAPSDAAAVIRQLAKYISPCKGGEGCVRDVIEKVLTLRGDWKLDTSVPSR